MRGVVLLRQVVARVEAQAALLQQPTDVVGALVEAGDDVDLTRHPALVVRGSTGQSAVEELLVRRAEAANVDHQRVTAGDGEVAQRGANLPRGVRREARKGDGALLMNDGGEIFL
jgi:hypothetical protein